MVERITVVIPNWNGLKWLQPCLQSLRNQSFKDFRTIVVDNGSVDGSVAFMRSEFPEVEVVELPVNIGFAGGMNAGIRRAQGEFVAALNNDTEVDAEWLAQMVNAIDSHPDYSIFASKIMDFKQRDIFDSIGDGYSRSGLSFKFAAKHRDNGSFKEPFEVFGACAAACLYRRSMLDLIGHYDDDFFAYMEDVDLCVRARMAGFRCLAVPGAIVYHVGSATSGGTASAFSVRLTARNLLTVMLKNMPAAVLPRMLLTTFVVQSGAVAEALLTNRRPWLRQHMTSYLKGLIEAMASLGTTLRKRKQVSRHWKLNAAQVSSEITRCKMQRRAIDAMLTKQS